MSKIEAYPPVFIVGQSGAGKSSIVRNISDPDRTVVLNTERKIMPTRNAMKLKNVDIDSWKKFKSTLDKAMESDAYDRIIIDSFTSLTELIYQYCKVAYNGFTVWEMYNQAIWEFCQGIKANKKPVYILGIDAPMEKGDDGSKRFIKVKGKEWLNSVEKEFAIVLYAEVIGENSDREHRLHTTPNSSNTAKSPDGMFEDYISNDVLVIEEGIEAYYGQ
jgi:GTPase SAR1 family protein